MVKWGDFLKIKKFFAIGIPLCALGVFAACFFASGNSSYAEVPYSYDREAFDVKMDTNQDGTITGDELKIIKIVDMKSGVSVDGALGESESYGYYKPKLQIRAMVTYDGSKRLKRLNDSRLRFDSYHWKKGDDGWYYYDELLSPGECAQFISGVKIPCEWDNKTAGKDFDIIITVQAAESFMQGGNEDTEVFEIKQNLFGSMKEMKDGKNGIVRVEEYEKDSHDNIRPYKNDKTVTPCEYVSKIVVFRIGNIVFRDGVPEYPEEPLVSIPPFIAQYIPKMGDDMSLFYYGAGFVIVLLIVVRLFKRNDGKKEKPEDPDRKE